MLQTLIEELNMYFAMDAKSYTYNKTEESEIIHTESKDTNIINLQTANKP